MALKHSKFRNTGILFELCVRQITTDLLNNKDSKAIKILKKYFTNTQLGEEYALYANIINGNKMSDVKSDALISTILEQHRTLDREKLEKIKYNLIKEIKANYDVNDFFKAKIDNYKVHAAIYNLFEAQHTTLVKDTETLVSNRITIREHLMRSGTQTKVSQDELVNELLKEDKEIRLMTYKILVKRFNDKYANMSERQKSVLKEYIYNITDTTKLKGYLNEELSYVKKELSKLQSSIKDPVMKIKIKEVSKLIVPIKENENIKDEMITGVLQYHELIEELKKHTNAR
jgi:hypothetical protein